MIEPAVWWVIAVAASLLSGTAVVWLLIGRRRTEPFAAVTVVVFGAMAAYALTMIASSYARADAVFYAFAFEIGAIGGGYALASTLLFNLARPLQQPPMEVSAESVDSRTAVILMCCIEPAQYDPRATAGMLQSLTDEGLLELSIGSLPFLFFAHKARYRGMGDASPSRPQLIEATRLLQQRLGDDVAVVDWASCSGPARLALRVSAAVRRGHSRIVITRLAVAPSVHMVAAHQELDGLRLQDHGISIADAERVVRSDRVPEMLVERTMSAISDSAFAGVVLVGHGQPEERARRAPEFGEDETIFLSRLRMLLVDRGLPDDRVRIAWSEWTDPGITSQVRHLAALGCREILVVPAVFALDTLSTSIDLGLAAQQARLDPAVSIHVLPAWGPDPAVIEELAEVTLAAMEHSA